MSEPPSATAGLQLIGRFFWCFSQLEAAIDTALASVLGFADHPAAGAISLIDLRKKIAMLNAAVPLSQLPNGMPTQNDWRAKALADIKRIHSLGDTRNDFAHAQITAESDGSIRLSRGDKRVWDAARFEKTFADIEELRRSFVSMGAALQGVAKTVEAAGFLVANSSISAPETGRYQITGSPTGDPAATRAEPGNYTITISPMGQR